jgi:hypothetical protein
MSPDNKKPTNREIARLEEIKEEIKSNGSFDQVDVDKLDPIDFLMYEKIFIKNSVTKKEIGIYKSKVNREQKRKKIENKKNKGTFLELLFKSVILDKTGKPRKI